MDYNEDKVSERTFGRSRRTGPAVVLTVSAVAVPGSGPLATRVAVPAEGLRDLGLRARPHHQPHR